MTLEMGLLRILGSRRARIAFNVVSAVVAVGVGLFTARHFMNHGWPLGHADVVLRSIDELTLETIERSAG